MKDERPDIPESIAQYQDIVGMLKSTWDKDSQKRPSASEIRDALEKHLRINNEEQMSYNPFRCVFSTLHDGI